MPNQFEEFSDEEKQIVYDDYSLDEHESPFKHSSEIDFLIEKIDQLIALQAQATVLLESLLDVQTRNHDI